MMEIGKQEEYEDIPEPTMTYESEESDDHEPTVLLDDTSAEELKMSLISNIFFLIGGVLFVWLAVWDIKSVSAYGDEYYDPSPTDDAHISLQMDAYTVLSIVASLAYLLNALADISWAIMDLKQNNELHIIDQNKGARWDVYSATAFGLGACVDLVASVFADYETPLLYNSGILSSQLFFFSALFALVGLQLSFTTLSECLIAFGNLLFMAGSAIDVVLSFIDDPRLVTEDSRVLANWALVSAVLWLVDAIFYLLSDLLELDFAKQESCPKVMAFFWRSETFSGKSQVLDTSDKEIVMSQIEIT